MMDQGATLDFNIEQYLLPRPNHHGWDPDGVIELLPLFRRAYPGCIADDVMSFQLARDSSSGSGDYRIRAVRPDGDRGGSALAKFDRGIHFDPEFFPDRYLVDVIYRLLEPEYIYHLQDAVGLFSPASYEMLCRFVREQSAWQQINSAAKGNQERADFFREVAIELAEHLASPVDLVAPTIREIKSQESFGLRAEQGTSRWRELGAEAFEPSLLHEIAKSDVESEIWQQFYELPEPVQLAVWFSTVVEKELPGGDCLTQWDAPSEPRKEWKFWGLDDLFDDVRQQVMGQASEDHFSARERAATIDQDEDD
jgi:hypothetical protein